MTQNATESKSVIDVREAARIARDYIQHAFADEGISAIQLEEVELSDDEKYWYVTIGFDTKRKVLEDYYEDLLNEVRHKVPKYVRDYKAVIVRASDGKVESVKIREI
jgi:hypothetical protein